MSLEYESSLFKVGFKIDLNIFSLSKFWIRMG